jgi:hypothetical protein
MSDNCNTQIHSNELQFEPRDYSDAISLCAALADYPEYNTGAAEL